MVTIRCYAYNQEAYIRDCLEGFVMQKTNFRFEAIVHDDASMEGRLLLDKINYENGTIESEGTVYQMKDTFFPTVDPTNAYVLSEAEQEVMDNLRFAFVNSHRLHEHVKFLYDKGCMYKCYNGNLLYHGCIPLDEEGNFDGVKFGGCIYTGKSYLDYAEKIARKAWSAQASQWDLDFMWYLWCGRKSPLSGRNVKTFSRFLYYQRQKNQTLI